MARTTSCKRPGVGVGSFLLSSSVVPLVASLLLVAMPGAPSSFLLLLVRHLLLLAWHLLLVASLLLVAALCS